MNYTADVKKTEAQIGMLRVEIKAYISQGQYSKARESVMKQSKLLNTLIGLHEAREMGILG